MDRTYIKGLITVFEKHDLFLLAKDYSRDASDLITIEYMNHLNSTIELFKFCSIVRDLIYPMFRNKYGRDRKNDGRALLDKVHPFMDDFYPIFDRIANDRNELLKEEWNMK